MAAKTPKPSELPVEASSPIDWSAAMAEHEPWLKRVIAARVRQADAVDDVFQNVSMAAVRQKAPLRDGKKVAPWLYRLAVLQSLLYRRKMGRSRNLVSRYTETRPRHEFTDEAADPLDWLLARERQEQVRQALRQIPRKEAEILALKYGENWSYEDIAEHLGLTRSAVESRLFRARQRLRQKLTQEQAEETKP